MEIASRQVLSPAYRLVLRLEIDNRPGMFARVAQRIGEMGCSLGAIDLVEATPQHTLRDVTVDCPDEGTGVRLADSLRELDGVNVRAVSDRTLLVHLGGKIEVKGRIPVRTRDELSLVYTPGVARVCRVIAADEERAWTLTMKRNAVAVVTDGTAILGLGDIGPLAGLPVMEGKAMLFAELAGVNAFPIVLGTKNPDEVIDTVVRISPGFGGINLEDIAAPACFYVERRLRELLDIPVFHDDQHGTAIVVLAALRNAAAVVGVPLASLKIVIAGAGAAGIATARLLAEAGVRAIRLCDRQGVVHSGRADINEDKRATVRDLDPSAAAGTLADAVRGAHVFIGVSGPRILSMDMLRSMARPRIVFALSNPDPEIDPIAAAPETDIFATGRSDFPNQVNNALAFPGVFRGLLDSRSSSITTRMELAAAEALAATVVAEARSAEYILPSVFDRDVVPNIAAAVAEAAAASGVARRAPRVQGLG
ncbi:MAG: NAD-dependent malic enzyme [Chloroflexi bacterium]|nr:NAD-dependent malic enzyme [Chloroflexota bacterium]